MWVRGWRLAVCFLFCQCPLKVNRPKSKATACGSIWKISFSTCVYGKKMLCTNNSKEIRLRAAITRRELEEQPNNLEPVAGRSFLR